MKRARENAKAVRADIAALEDDAEAAVKALEASFDAQKEPLEALTVRAKSTDITVHLMGLVWAPHYRHDETRAARFEPAFSAPGQG